MGSRLQRLGALALVALVVVGAFVWAEVVLPRRMLRRPDGPS